MEEKKRIRESPDSSIIDRHLIHACNFPAGRKKKRRKGRGKGAGWNPSVSTTERLLPILDTDAKLQGEKREKRKRKKKTKGAIVHIIGRSWHHAGPLPTLFFFYIPPRKKRRIGKKREKRAVLAAVSGAKPLADAATSC